MGNNLKKKNKYSRKRIYENCDLNNLNFFSFKIWKILVI